MIIECNGLPGCGKTTLTKELVSNLNKEGKKTRYVGVAQFRGKNKGFLKLPIFLNRIIIPINPKNLFFSFNAMTYIIKSWRQPNFFGKIYESYIAFLYCVYLFNIYRKYSTDIVITDEGMIQALTSFSFYVKSDVEMMSKLLKITKKLKLKITFINCNITIKKTISRIELRNRHDSAIDELSNAQLTEFLQTFYEKLKFLRTEIQMSDSVNIQMENTPQTLVRYIKYEEGAI